MSHHQQRSLTLHIPDGDLIAVITRGQWLMDKSGNYPTYNRGYRADTTDGASPLLYRLLRRLEVAAFAGDVPLLYLLSEVRDIHEDDDEDNAELDGIADITAVCKNLIRWYTLANYEAAENAV